LTRARGVGNNGSTMPLKLSDKKLAVLGAGKLGGILLRAYLRQKLFTAKRVTATVKHGEKASSMGGELKVFVTTDNRKAVKGADIVLLGVKPQAIAEVLKEIAPEVSEKTLIISVAASVPTGYLEQHLGAKVPVTRDAEYPCGGRLRNDGNLPRRACRPGASGNCTRDV
jgi:pyrroline-5-carboxylate reductase